MDNNLISNILQLERTNLIRGGTDYSSTPFELKLQLHGQVSNPYTFSIKDDYKSSATIKVNTPPYTEKSWTTPGTYSWTVPAGVTRIRVAVCGGGGGGWGTDSEATNGGTSSFGNLIQATGGGVSYRYMDDDDCIFVGGAAGVPNGIQGSTKGFALNFIKQEGSYGNGGYGLGPTVIYHGKGNANSGTGGYDSKYINVSPSNNYTIIVGAGGKEGKHPYDESWSYWNTDGTSGFVLIAYGEGIE